MKYSKAKANRIIGSERFTEDDSIAHNFSGYTLEYRRGLTNPVSLLRTRATFLLW